VKRYIVGLFGGAFCGVLLGLLFGGCTPAQQAAATSHTITGVRIAACVQGVLAEEERARMLERRLAEEQAELEAERLKAEAEEKAKAETHDAPSTVAQEIDKVVRDGGTKE